MQVRRSEYIHKTSQSEVCASVRAMGWGTVRHVIRYLTDSQSEIVRLLRESARIVHQFHSSTNLLQGVSW